MKPCGLRTGKFTGDRKMAEKAKGETVRATAEQHNEKGEVISRATIEWYGFDNAGGNQASMDLVMGVFQTADGWRKAKAEMTGGKTPNEAIR